jgi:hypothetical protein
MKQQRLREKEKTNEFLEQNAPLVGASQTTGGRLRYSPMPKYDK